MGSYSIIDRRKNPRGKNLPNRQRFIERVKHKIQKHLKENSNKRSITSDEHEKVIIDSDGAEEPNFQYDANSGIWNHVLPGNRNFVPGDQIPKPLAQGSRQGNRAGHGDGTDGFVFDLSKDEYLDIVFEDLELPDLVKRSEKAAVNWQRRRAGSTKQGAAANLDLLKSLRNSLGRRIALAFPLDRQIQELSKALEAESDPVQRSLLEQQLADLRRRRLSVAYIDPVDIRYKRYERVPIPNSQAVMFCLMDVSGSMSEFLKELSKRFFLLLYLFLRRKYTKVDVVFIRHTDRAKAVTEQEFFYSTESGGTELSSALILMREIIREKYDPQSWNLYCVQATDGDNVPSDNEKMLATLRELLPMFQYFVYNEVRGDGLNFGSDYSPMTAARLLEDLQSSFDNLEIISLDDIQQVVPTFRRVFARDGK